MFFFEAVEQLAIVLLGSNIGDRELHLRHALEGMMEAGTIDRLSEVFESTAWGIEDQAHFLNMVAGIRTSFRPGELLVFLKGLEQKLGRLETFKWGPRIIDLDILFYGNQIIEEAQLKIPHPQLELRRFTLLPLAGAYPKLAHPVSGLTAMEMLRNCSDNGNVYFYKSHL